MIEEHKLLLYQSLKFIRDLCYNKSQWTVWFFFSKNHVFFTPTWLLRLYFSLLRFLAFFPQILHVKYIRNWNGDKNCWHEKNSLKTNCVISANMSRKLKIKYILNARNRLYVSKLFQTPFSALTHDHMVYIYGMAAKRLMLCAPVCFIFSKYGKLDQVRARRFLQPRRNYRCERTFN